MFPEAVRAPRWTALSWLDHIELSGQRFHQPEGIWENKPIPQGLQTFPWSAFNDYDVLIS